MQSPQAVQAPATPPAPATPVTIAPIPAGGGRVIIDKEGDRTIVTSASLPPDIMALAQRAEETAFGLMGLLAVIIIVGPFARMWARRIEKRAELDRVDRNAELLQQQLMRLQQSMDAMSVEVERISESQRFQSRLLGERKTS
jgi:hypothetical protein